MHALIGEYRARMPTSFPGKLLDSLTANALRWRTIQNLRSRKAIPASCFVKISSRKVLILRDPFLEWLAADMSKF